MIKEMALTQAIEKARRSADIIAVGLGDVLDVRYNFDGGGVVRRRYDYLEDVNICESSYDFNIMPQDCRYSESVSVVWEIEKMEVL